MLNKAPELYYLQPLKEDMIQLGVLKISGPLTEKWGHGSDDRYHGYVLSSASLKDDLVLSITELNALNKCRPKVIEFRRSVV